MLPELNDAKKWTYISEGKKNAVFAFNDCLKSNTNSTNSLLPSEREQKESVLYQGYILRVPKSDLVLAATLFPYNENTDNYSQNIKETSYLSNDNSNLPSKSSSSISDTNGYRNILTTISFQEHLIQRQLGAQYIDIVKPAHFSLSFLAELRFNTLKEKLVPPSRLRDWFKTKSEFVENTGVIKRKDIKCYGGLHRNHTLMQSSSQPCLSLEIKPKAVRL